MYICVCFIDVFFFFSSRRRHTRYIGDWSSDVCSSDLAPGAASAKDKPLSWKPVEDALLRVNDAPPKEWEVYRAGKKNEPLLLQIGNRLLLMETHDRKVFQLDPSKTERTTGEILSSPPDQPPTQTT